MAERLALPTSDHGVAGSNPAGGEILPERKRRFIAQSLSCSPFHRLEMTEILLKGRKTLTHPSFLFRRCFQRFSCCVSYRRVEVCVHGIQISIFVYLRGNVTGENMLITFCPGCGSNPQHPTLYRVAIKSRLVPQGSTSMYYT